MTDRKCLYCYRSLEGETGDYHGSCSKAFFGTAEAPILEYTLSDMERLAGEIAIKSVAVTGVQPKLSLDLEASPKDPKRTRLTLVGLWGSYILKPPTKTFPHLPENEDLTMHLAEIAGTVTAEHSLIRLRSGELAYITKRFDRNNGKKIPVEDMCQLTETLTEDKYRSSMEKVGKTLRQYSDAPGLDAFRLFTLTVFCYVTGNADMHLKNFSLIKSADDLTLLSPAYDLVNTRLAMPSDKEEIALTLNAKKNKMTRKDFDFFGRHLKLPEKTMHNAYAMITNSVADMKDMINRSFLNKESKAAYTSILEERMRKLEN